MSVKKAHSLWHAWDVTSSSLSLRPINTLSGVSLFNIRAVITWCIHFTMMHTVWRHELNDLLQVVLDLLYTQGLPTYVTSYLGQSNPIVWPPHSFSHCACDCSNEFTGQLFQFWLIQRVTKRQLTDTVFPCTVATSIWGTVWHIAVAILIVNRRKALLANCLALCYDSWTSRRQMDYFSKVQIEAEF